jgi:hypothetical protein
LLALEEKMLQKEFDRFVIGMLEVVELIPELKVLLCRSGVSALDSTNVEAAVASAFVECSVIGREQSSTLGWPSFWTDGIEAELEWSPDRDIEGAYVCLKWELVSPVSDYSLEKEQDTSESRNLWRFRILRQLGADLTDDEQLIKAALELGWSEVE